MIRKIVEIRFEIVKNEILRWFKEANFSDKFMLRGRSKSISLGIMNIL